MLNGAKNAQCSHEPTVSGEELSGHSMVAMSKPTLPTITPRSGAAKEVEVTSEIKVLVWILTPNIALLPVLILPVFSLLNLVPVPYVVDRVVDTYPDPHPKIFSQAA